MVRMPCSGIWIFQPPICCRNCFRLHSETITAPHHHHFYYFLLLQTTQHALPAHCHVLLWLALKWVLGLSKKCWAWNLWTRSQAQLGGGGKISKITRLGRDRNWSRAFYRRLANCPTLGGGGKISWTRHQAGLLLGRAFNRRLANCPTLGGGGKISWTRHQAGLLLGRAFNRRLANCPTLGGGGKIL